MVLAQPRCVCSFCFKYKMTTAIVSNLSTYEELAGVVTRLLLISEELDLMLSEYQPNKKRDEIQTLKDYCDPILLLQALQACLTEESGVIEVLDDLRGVTLEDEFFKCETVDWLIDSLSGVQLGTKPEQSPPHAWLSDQLLFRFPKDISACYESVLSSYFSLLGVSANRRNAWNFWSKKIFGTRGVVANSTDQETWEKLQRAYFESIQKRKNFLNNLLAAIRNPAGSSQPAEQLDEGVTKGEYGFVYFVRNGDLHKIGITENLLRRFGELQPDEVLNVVRCKNFQDVERKLHSEFRAIRLPQTEYFRMQADHVAEAHRLLLRFADM